ncbi:FtsK/SpoIIIE domain-containing protein [Paenibacillus dakarensis]|uniref:FtsK/SpoIIIE domain-containing protein n=1 Tax=Paenibacillus dakarensis TaxID=1527293 RepID=UPI001FE1FAF1|nr:FtsK/SpoIIIE domain-containing protein [Paenibacillus dakarensis]
MRLPVYVGKSRTGDVAYDMVDHPHLLIAGETGSGKSVALRSILTSLIRQVGAKLELYCADLKRSEFHVFRGVAREVVTDVSGLERIVLRLQREMRHRGDLMDAEEVAHIDDLPADKRPPYIVLAIDEVALLKREKDVMDGVEEISTIGRALGVFLVLAMQRPDAGVLDGRLKNNLTVRMAFRHSDAINSRITIGSDEAARILDRDKGRMVFKLNGCEYVQGPHLTLAAARTLLNPYKNANAIAKPNVNTSVSDNDIIELEVL